MAEHASIRAALEDRLARLTRRTQRIESDLRRPGDRDSAERATERENDEVLENLSVREREEIAQIRGALQRLDAGRYGRCGRCGGSIEPARLEALPFTETCIDCADAHV